MDRQLSVERRGELFHLKLHNYRGPWEGHQIESILDLKEVEPPEGGEDYEQVLGPNQCYLWREMTFDPELHALVTADRLDSLARLVDQWTIRVVVGEEFLPEVTDSRPIEQPELAPEQDTSYIEVLDRRHESVWSRGPKAVMGAVLVRAIPLVVLVCALVVAGRHMGDKHELVGMDEVFARANRPVVEQSLIAGLVEPDYTNLLRHEIRSIRFAHANRMIVGDGHYVEFVGVNDLMPWLTKAQRTRNAVVVDLDCGDGSARITEVRCGSEVLGRDLELRKIARLRSPDALPPRAGVATGSQFQLVGALEWDRLADRAVEQLGGQRISIEGTLVDEGGKRVLRVPGTGAGMLIETPRINDKLRQFLQVFTDDGARVRLDLLVVETFPWRNRSDPERQREDSKLVGVAEVFSASAQNHHVIGRL